MIGQLLRRCRSMLRIGQSSGPERAVPGGSAPQRPDAIRGIAASDPDAISVECPSTPDDIRSADLLALMLSATTALADRLAAWRAVLKTMSDDFQNRTSTIRSGVNLRCGIVCL